MRPERVDASWRGMLIAATWPEMSSIKILKSQNISHGRHMKKGTSLLIVKKEKRLALPWPLGREIHAGQHDGQEEDP